ncbi:MAG: hypothetical protein IIB82_08200 [Bacteroidetes bacterium]|nr:hypothetical protein [Bacteroidota bacterium]
MKNRTFKAGKEYAFLGEELVEMINNQARAISISHHLEELDRPTYIDAYTDALEGKIPLYKDKYIRKLLKERAR